MTTTTTRYLALDNQTQWNMTTLHLIGHPIPAAAWYHLQDMYAAGWTPESAAHVFDGHDGHPPTWPGYLDKEK